jgi:superfamily II DNA or RNA helicase
MSRTFNRKQREAILEYYDYKCAICGKELDSSFHADHIVPHSKNGPTDVLNAQALCPQCNLQKGDKLMQAINPWPEHIELRQWQHRAFSKYLESDKIDFLAVATPGAGKTLFSLRVAHLLLQLQKIERVVAICPTRHLAEQWAEKAAAVGIHLDPEWSNRKSGESEDYHGVALTYQQVDSNPEVSRIQCSRRSTLAIFDEIHHAGDNLSWGENIRTAFGIASYRLAISGTPFRSDNNQIPFVEYDSGKSMADFSYSYGDSLRDGICRPVYFPSYEGDIEWFSAGEFVSARFRDELSEKQRRERLNMAISTGGDWMPKVISDADQKLAYIRANGHPDAAGLIICKKIGHAQAISELMQDSTRCIGITPVMVHSDDKDASRKIDKFKTSNQRWMIAVKMVSEGVDIPRLRVGIYATNVTTELFFRQAVGRFVRMIEDIEDQASYIYIPREDILIQFAQEIKAEREHQLTEEIETVIQERQQATEQQLNLSYLVSSTAHKDDVIYDEDVFTPDEIRHATMIAEQAGLSSAIDRAQIAKMLKLHEQLSGPKKTEDTKPQIQTKPLHQVKQKRREIINQQKREITYAKKSMGYTGSFSEIIRDVSVEGNKLSGKYIPIEDATLYELDRLITFYSDQLSDLRNIQDDRS